MSREQWEELRAREEDNRIEQERVNELIIASRIRLSQIAERARIEENEQKQAEESRKAREQERRNEEKRREDEVKRREAREAREASDREKELRDFGR